MWTGCWICFILDIWTSLHVINYEQSRFLLGKLTINEHVQVGKTWTAMTRRFFTHGHGLDKQTLKRGVEWWSGGLVFPIWLSNIAMENPRTKWWFIAGKMIYKWAIYTMAMLNNQMVILFFVGHGFFEGANLESLGKVSVSDRPRPRFACRLPLTRPGKGWHGHGKSPLSKGISTRTEPLSIAKCEITTTRWCPPYLAKLVMKFINYTYIISHTNHNEIGVIGTN